MNGTKTKMVVDIATDRIIWFGPMDFPLDETNIEGAALAFYEGALPTALKSSNAWTFRLRDQKIIAPVPKSVQTPESPIEASKKVLLKTIIDLTDSHRSSNGVPQTVAAFLLCDKDSIMRAIDITQRTENLRQLYSEHIRAASQSGDLLVLKNEFIEKLNEIKTGTMA